MTEERDSQHTEDPSASAEAQTGGLGAQRGAQVPSRGMPAAPPTLTEWMIEQIDADENWLIVGDHERPGLCGCGEGSKNQPRRPDCLDRIAGECAMRRRMVNDLSPDLTAGNAEQAYAEYVLRALATAYFDRPGYLEEEWAI